AVVRRSRHRDLELARQIRELRMQHRVLPKQLAVDARIRELVPGDAGVLVGRDVAHAVAGRLDRRDLDARELLEDIGNLLELDPVVLDVLARREVAEAAIVLARDLGELAQLPRRQRAVRHVDAKHVGVQLKVDAVLQPQGLELVFRQLAVEPPADLPPELPNTLGDEAMVELVVTVHIVPIAGCRTPRASGFARCRPTGRTPGWTRAAIPASAARPRRPRPRSRSA